MSEEKKVEEIKSVFSTLNDVDVSKRVEKKQNLSYLSWSWAWTEVKKRYPNATYTIYEREAVIDDRGNTCPINYFTDGLTAWVKVGVTIEGLEHIEQLPIMDLRNNSLPLVQVNSMNVNKTIKRCLTKACAMHGLGMYIYAGEDLPDIKQQEVSQKQVVEAHSVTLPVAGADGKYPFEDLKKAVSAMAKKCITKDGKEKLAEITSKVKSGFKINTSTAADYDVLVNIYNELVSCEYNKA